MNGHALTKTQMLMALVGRTDGATVMFAVGADERSLVLIDRDAWEDLGEPQQVTVTIRAYQDPQ